MLIAALYEVDSLSAQVSSIEDWQENTRRLCGVLLQTPDFWLTSAPGTAQEESVPALVVGQTSYEQHCQALKNAYFQDLQWNLVCDTETLSLTTLSP